MAGIPAILLICLSVQYTAAYIEALAGNIEVPATPTPEPQVAMICGEKSTYHNKYLSRSGKWVNDLDTKAKCLDTKADILKYCQKVYHDREIVNIVEASEVIKLTDWCKVDHRKCKGSHWVKPYRCLEGVFQSDALLVPDTCQFNHLHNETQCKSYGEWDSTARRNCIQHSMELQSVGMLLPCGIDVFRGVEFVCCPKNNQKESETKHHTSPFGENKKEVSQHLDEDEEDDDEYLDDDEEYDDDDEYDEDDDYDDDEDSSEEKAPEPTADPYFTHFDARNEHRDFKDAQERMEKHHREKITTVMKDWADLEERYQDMRNKDANKAETFRKKMTLKFQDTVHALETEVDGEKHQLNVMHQQRVLAHINQRKKEAMGCYTKALGQHPPNAHQVEKCLQKLLRALHKDRHHTISHYRHLLNSEFEQAEQQKDIVVAHLNTIDKEVNQSLSMLNRYPSLSRKMIPLMKEYVEALRARDSTPAALLPVNHENEEKLVDQYRDQAQHKLKIKQKAKIAEEARKAEKMKAHREKKLSVEAEQENMIHSPEQVPEQLVHHTLQQIQIHHVQDSGLSHETSQFSVVRESVSTTSQSVYVSLAFAGVALMAALVVGMLILRRRNARSPQGQGFVEVDQSVSPEERHVNNMQVNGYENPTYKYFEAHDT